MAALTDCQPPRAGGAQELRLLSSLVFVPLVSRRSRTWLRSSSVHILPVPICESFPRPRSSPRTEKLSPQRCLAISQHQGLSSRPVVVTRPSFPCPASQSNARPPLHPIPRTSASRFSSSRSACFASLHVPHLTPPLVWSCPVVSFSRWPPASAPLCVHSCCPAPPILFSPSPGLSACEASHIAAPWTGPPELNAQPPFLSPRGALPNGAYRLHLGITVILESFLELLFSQFLSRRTHM